VIAATQWLTGQAGDATTVSFGTEAGIYAAAGIPTLECGPGDINRAHKADEWIGLDELAASDRMMQRLASQLGKPAEEWIR
jgi:acetylornithine deacetylase